jgi:hypothetical protein
MAAMLNDLALACEHIRKVRRNPAVLKIFEDLGCEGLLPDTAEGGGPGGAWSIAVLAKALFRGKLDSKENFRLLFGKENSASLVHRLARSCSHCERSEIRSGIKVSACKGCRVLYYCSSACQKLAWPEHKPMCLEMRKSAGRLVQNN